MGWDGAERGSGVETEGDIERGLNSEDKYF